MDSVCQSALCFAIYTHVFAICLLSHFLRRNHTGDVLACFLAFTFESVVEIRYLSFQLSHVFLVSCYIFFLAKVLMIVLLALLPSYLFIGFVFSLDCFLFFQAGFRFPCLLPCHLVTYIVANFLLGLWISHCLLTFPLTSEHCSGILFTSIYS